MKHVAVQVAGVVYDEGKHLTRWKHLGNLQHIMQ